MSESNNNGHCTFVISEVSRSISPSSSDLSSNPGNTCLACNLSNFALILVILPKISSTCCVVSAHAGGRMSISMAASARLWEMRVSSSSVDVALKLE